MPLFSSSFCSHMHIELFIWWLIRSREKAALWAWSKYFDHVHILTQNCFKNKISFLNLRSWIWAIWLKGWKIQPWWLLIWRAWYAKFFGKAVLVSVSSVIFNTKTKRLGSYFGFQNKGSARLTQFWADSRKSLTKSTEPASMRCQGRLYELHKVQEN